MTFGATRRTQRQRWLPALAVALALSGCQPDATGPSVSGIDGKARTPIAISAVQGAGGRSPRVGESVTVRGVVVGTFIDGLGGFFIHSPPGAEDDDPDTAEGLFVEWPPSREPRPQVGDLLEVSGLVAELGDEPASLTSLIDARWRKLGAAEPPVIEIGSAPAGAAGWEALEGARVLIPAPLTLTGHYGLFEYGELLTSFDGRLVQPTELAPPGPAAADLAADNARRALLLDDGSDQRRPQRLWALPQPPQGCAPLRVGSVFHGAEGVVDQRHGRYRLQLIRPLEAIGQASRPPPPTLPGSLRVASLNLLNLFNGDGRGGGFPTPRGARTPEQYQRQQTKLVAQIRALAPDIAALMEIENDGFGPDSALAQLVAELDRSEPAAQWRFVDAGSGPGSDQIRVALIYRAATVRPVAAPVSLDAGPFATGSRPPLAQAFRQGDGPVFVVAANHFKSKGGCDQAEDLDRNQGDGQACFNASRVAAATALSEWLHSDPTRTGSDLAVIIGDLNAYSHEDPLQRLRREGWLSLAGPDAGFSYVYDGVGGRLDHALASPALAERVRGAAYWAVNAEENAAFGHERDHTGQPWAGSDHNPLLIGIDLGGRPERPTGAD